MSGSGKKDGTASRVVIRFGHRVTAGRRRNGWTIAELSAKAGVGVTIISNLEHGRQGCTLDSAVPVASALGIDMNGLDGPCGQCRDKPPAGFICGDCGASGPQRGEADA